MTKKYKYKVTCSVYGNGLETVIGRLVNYGTITIKASMWKNEFLLETFFPITHIRALPFVVSVEEWKENENNPTFS
jgi:hypothetical protein